MVAHGANPGLVSHFTKQALVNLARDNRREDPRADHARGLGQARPAAGRQGDPHRRARHPGLAQAEGSGRVRQHLVDRRLRLRGRPARRDGLGHAREDLPPDGKRHTFGCDAAIYLNRPGLLTQVRTWTPIEGPFHGIVITHNESISIADYLTVHDGKKVVYRPTVHYAYHPCDQAIISMHEIAGKNLKQQKRQRLIVDEVTSGRDELGVLLMGHKRAPTGTARRSTSTRRAAWCPTTTRPRSRSWRRCSRASSGRWRNPNEGIVEADEMDFRRNLEICMPYLGPSSASTATGPRCRAAANSSPRTSTSPTPGISRTSGWSDKALLLGVVQRPRRRCTGLPSQGCEQWARILCSVPSAGRSVEWLHIAPSLRWPKGCNRRGPSLASAGSMARIPERSWSDLAWPGPSRSTAKTASTRKQWRGRND